MSLLQATSRAFRPALALSHRRTLVSSVLLTKEWDRLTTHQLRQEARDRNLPAKGSKAHIIARLQEHEQRSASSLSFQSASPSSSASPAGARNASTTSPPPPTLGKPSMPVAPKPSELAKDVPATNEHTPEVLQVAPVTAESVAPAPGADAPGIPPSAQVQTPYPKNYMNVKLPDLTIPLPELSAPIPYGPDFWHSVPASSTQPATPKAPKLLVVAGAATHPGGGPVNTVHEAVDPNAPLAAPTPTPATSTMDKGFWASIAEDAGLPTQLARQDAHPQHLTFEGLPEKTEAYGARSDNVSPHSRALEDDERRGLWVLGGLLAGAWVVAGWFEKESAVGAKAKQAAEQVKGVAQEKMQEAKGVAKDVQAKAAAKTEEVKSAVKGK